MMKITKIKENQIWFSKDSNLNEIKTLLGDEMLFFYLKEMRGTITNDAVKTLLPFVGTLMGVGETPEITKKMVSEK